MVYNKEHLLQMLSSAPLYEGKPFHEGKHEDFLGAMGEDFCDRYDYAHGATKFVIIPNNPKADYVIKIPYTGCYNAESGYYLDTFYQSGYEDYFEYCAADDEDRPWDYCAAEVKRYKIASKRGFGNCFAKIELLGFINNYPVYIQERCIVFKASNHSHSEEENKRTSNCCDNYYGINQNWLTDFRLYHSGTKLYEFTRFIHKKGWDDDLRNENIGYIKNRPVLIDYSGFLD